MIVKIVTADGGFDLIAAVKRCSFRKNPSGAVAVIEHDNGETEEQPIARSAFALNDDGKTIDQFHSSRN